MNGKVKVILEIFKIKYTLTLSRTITVIQGDRV
jgi:hypothetical protein